MTDEELVRWVAENVMGFYWHPGLKLWCNDSGAISGTTGWLPLTNLNHAFMVVKKMREKGWEVRIHDGYGDWRVEFEHWNPNIKESEGDHKNLGHAILLAAIATKGGT